MTGFSARLQGELGDRDELLDVWPRFDGAGEAAGPYGRFCV